MTVSVTAANLRALGPRGKFEYIEALALASRAILPAYGIDTPLRVAHFWAQAAHECDGFRTMHEYWGPTPAQARYEGRRDLGNTAVGDGHRFRGRGIFQLTGRANYQTVGAKLGLTLTSDPELAAVPVNALQIACEYWVSRKLNELADKNDLVAITKRINGGTNGLADRRARFNTAWKIWGAAPALAVAEIRPAPDAIPPAKKETIVTQEVQGQVRHILTLVGGILVNTGYVQSSWIEPAIGVALAVVGMVWSYVAKKTA